MGTRSTVTFIGKYKDQEATYVTIYQQFDGYIKGVGHDLARWLLKKTIINGISGQDMSDSANGTGCLAAQFIHDFKIDIGGLYIASEDDREDYNYFVIVDEYKLGKADDCITIIVTNWDDDDEPIFTGTPSKLLKFEEEEE